MSTASQTFSNPGAVDESLSDTERVQNAMQSFATHFGANTAANLESCIHCGMCAEACHYYIATEDPKYTPILKVEPFKKAYRRESGAFAPFFKLFGFKSKITADELEQWQELLFDSCNQCGRCSLICPMGIEVAELIEIGRRGMFEAGLAPRELAERAHRQAETGQPEQSDTPYPEMLAEIGRKYDVDIPLDRDTAEVMACVPRTDLENNPSAIAAMAQVLNATGTDYTFRSDALVAENYGYYAGSRGLQRKISMRIIDQAKKIKASTVLVPECGHAYTALRWQAAELAGEPLPFRVRHVTEYLAELLEAGKLKLNKIDGESFAFHDPCQIVRKGGVTDAPRALMNAMGVNLREMPNKKGFSFCCAGGGGVNDLERAKPLRYKAQELKLNEVDSTGAKRFLTSCSDCRVAFNDAGEHFNWDKRPESLVELVAANIKE
ncbi:MAG: (Fe-S)-binding protein [Wenzhouxiangellaceae bacterium]|nr:(Fe-S)-binding protein [Wenzhouxiangellaceae bacterium]